MNKPIKHQKQPIYQIMKQNYQNQEQNAAPTSYLIERRQKLQSNSSGREMNQKNQQIDRFIPNRKMMQRDYLSAKQQKSYWLKQSQNKQRDTEVIPNIFKQYIICEKNKKTNSKTIEIYQNSNLFRYGQVYHQPKQHFNDNIIGLKLCDSLKGFKNINRKINKFPIKVLDAPALQDDFYLNLVDWSNSNFLIVGLATSVYLWNANNSKVTKLCDLGIYNQVSSVSSSPKDCLAALGTNNGEVQIWDLVKVKKTNVLTGHSLRVGTIAWNSNILSTGSRDQMILQRDLRSNTPYVRKLIGHKQEVCGLKWSYDQQQLCSGGNDNKLLIWNSHSTEPIIKFQDHLAAVKAMAWSPHQHGLLVSGGGTADRTIKFRNTLTGTTIQSYDVGSQVCNLTFSRTLNQLVSTHGYSLNEINIWKYPEMKKISTLTGHLYRVLYLAMSPDGSTIVTGAGDETLRFWQIFPNGSEDIIQNENCLLEQENLQLR